MNGGSGAIDAASEPNDTHGSAICLRMLSSDIMKYTVPTRDRSSSTRFMIVSTGSSPRSLAASASVLPVSGFSVSDLNSTSSTRSG